MSAGELGSPQVAHLVREGRRVEVKGGIDFSSAEFDEESGKMCILKDVEVDTLKKEPILQCTHRLVDIHDSIQLGKVPKTS